MYREWSGSCSESERIIADIPLASVAAILPVSHGANVAPAPSADAPDSDFHSVLASYAPANDVVRDTASAPAKGNQVLSAPETQPVPQKQIKALSSAPRSVADTKKTADLSAGEDRSVKGRKEERQDRQEAAVPLAEPVIQPTVVSTVTPVSPAAPILGRSDIKVPADTVTAPAVHQSNDNPADGITDETSPSKSEPARAMGPESGLHTISNSPNASEYVAPSGKQANTPEVQGTSAIKPANPLSQPATNAAVPAAKSPTQQTESETQAASQGRPTQPIQPSVLAMLNVLRGAIVTTLSPKQAGAQTSGVNLDKPSASAATKAAASGVDASSRSAAVAKDAIKSTDVIRVSAPVTVDTSDDSCRPVAAVAQKQAQTATAAPNTRGVDPSTGDKSNDGTKTAAEAAQKQVQSPFNAPIAENADLSADNMAEPVVAITQTTPRAASSETTVSKTNGDKAPAQSDQHSTATAGLAPKLGDTAPAPTALQPATTAPQPSNIAVPAIVPSVATNAVAAPLQASAAAPSAHAMQDQAVSPNFAALATAIVAKSASGTKTFDIRMDPPELGRVDVHLSVDRDGKVLAMLSAEHPQTLTLLQKGSQDLERALKDAGLHLSNNSLNFSLKGEGRQGDGGGASMARARSLPDAVVARAEAANASEINLSSAHGNGRLDIRV